MLIKVVTLPFSSTHGGFVDDELREFLTDKELISANDYLVTKDNIPYLTFVLKYFPFRTEVAPTANKKADSEEWRRVLTEEQMGLFNLLRDWRSKRCKKDGVPPYVLLTNNQLAMIVKLRPQSLAELSKLDGIGKKKIDTFGLEILEITKLNVSASPPAETAGPQTSLNLSSLEPR